MSSIIERSSDNSFVISFPSGVGITINYTAGLLVYTLEVPLLFEGTTSGLLGNYNNDDSDEFTFHNGTMISNSSSDREIHQFGQSCKLIHTPKICSHNYVYSEITYMKKGLTFIPNAKVKLSLSMLVFNSRDWHKLKNVWLPKIYTSKHTLK